MNYPTGEEIRKRDVIRCIQRCCHATVVGEEYIVKSFEDCCDEEDEEDCDYEEIIYIKTTKHPTTEHRLEFYEFVRRGEPLTPNVNLEAK